MSLARVQKTPLKLPSGHTVTSNDPIKQFAINVWARREALIRDCIEEADGSDETYLSELWERDAINQRRGWTPDQRADALNIDRDGLGDFEAIVEALETHIWKKAADFYRGLLASGIFEQDIRVDGGIYHRHKIWSFEDIQREHGVSRATIFRRMREGVSLSELIKPPRSKAPVKYLTFEAKTYTALQFAAAFGLSKRHVREGIARGLSADQIIAAPRKRRGRPQGLAAVACGALKCTEAPFTAERASTHPRPS